MDGNPEAAKGSWQSEFDLGYDSSRDPANSGIFSPGGSGATTSLSKWLYRKCPVCTHTFRVGDLVRLDAQGMVRHEDDNPHCSGEAPASNPGSQDMAEFFRGLEAAWPPPKDTPIVRLFPGHELLAPAREGFQRKTCQVCGHTLRTWDLVVICPCSPTNPICMGAVHRDPSHDLPCLESWNPGGNAGFCPVTSRKLDGSEIRQA